ncbi:MAG TPA: hypothetical protein VHB27_22445 [Rhodopila sp.]|uniref:hypothetical protein n=1 Tax=Rhodopila sp. TaxID=2480087 RepID=UPI002B7FE43E|nr:hypothetical protein [Rhodopila sp.]HVY17995.1 hypothetical protein [Rhodopila sp.]
MRVPFFSLAVPVFAPLAACLLLSGCALPLIQMAGSQMLPGTPACAAGTACPASLGSEIAKGVGSSIQNLTGLASANPAAPK